MPQAVALQALSLPQPPSSPQSAVAGQFFVVATPQESWQVDIVKASVPHTTGQSGSSVPHTTGQSGSQVITPTKGSHVTSVTTAVTVLGQSAHSLSDARGSLAGAFGATSCLVESCVATYTEAPPKRTTSSIRTMEIIFFLFIIIVMWC